MKRILALDVGSVRIGVAISDPLGSFAQAHCVLQAAGPWMEEVASIIGQQDVDTLLIGMPRRTDGTDGPEAERMRKLAEKLAGRFPDVKVVEWDERFTTTIATQALLEADVSRRGRRGQVDKVAATLLLQSYLDAGHGRVADIHAPAIPEMPSLGKGAKPRNWRRSAYD